MSLHYPEDWIQVHDEQPGDIVFATHKFGLYRGLELESAAVIVAEDWSGIADPLQALEEYYLGGDRIPGMTILEPPKSLILNGQLAATALISFDREDGTLLNRLTIISGSNQSAFVTALSGEEAFPDYLPIFETILNSIVIGRAPAPAQISGEHDGALQGLIEYIDARSGIGLRHPPDWEIVDAFQGIQLKPSALLEEDAFNQIQIFRTDEFVGDSEPDLEGILRLLLLRIQLISKVLDDAHLVGDVAIAEFQDKRIARAIVVGTEGDMPVLAIFQVVQQGENMAIAIVQLTDDVTYRSAVEKIMDSISLVPRTFSLVEEAVEISHGKFFEGQLMKGGQVDFRFYLDANTRVVAVFQMQVDLSNKIRADLDFYDPQRDFFHSGSALSSLISTTQFVTDNSGEHYLSVRTSQGIANEEPDLINYRLVILELEPAASGVVEFVEGSIAQGQTREYAIDARAGEWWLIIVEPDSKDSVLRMDLLDSSGIELDTDFVSSSLIEAFIIEIPKTGRYLVSISPPHQDSGGYRLLLVKAKAD